MVIGWWSAVASAATVQILLEPRELERGQTGRARVIVTAAASEAVDTSRPPELPTAGGVQARFSGQMARSNRIQQGTIRRSVEFEYLLSAAAVGSWTVGPAVVTVGGAPVRSEPVSLTVRPRAAGPAVEEAVVFAGFDAGQGLVSAVEAWEGQVVTYRRGLRYRSNLSADFRDPPLDGFRTLQKGQPAETRYVITDEAGELMVTEGLLPVVASGVGRHDLGPVTATVRVPVGRRFGLMETRTEVFASEPLSLTVRPLPTPPAGFSGLVGDLSLRSTLRSTPVPVGESVPFTLVVSGTADLEGLRLPDPAIPGMSVYPSDPVVKAVVGANGLEASATFSWELVPTEAGTLALPPYEVVAFSPTKGVYETLRVELPPLVVTPGKDGDGALRAFGSTTAIVTEEGDALRPPYAWGRSTRTDAAPVLLGVAGLALLPAAGWLGADAVRALLARRRRVEIAERPPTARELLAGMPEAPEARLQVLDHALRLAEAGREGDPRVRDLRKRLGRARFGGGPPDPGLEDDVRRLVEVFEREAA